jgi:uncharacterized protein YdeI (YjbR/CyaY-like superfamily)
MGANSDKELLKPEDQAAWFHWLSENAATHDGVRLQLVRKNGAFPGLGYAQALDGALCYGWIDGQAMSFDENYSLRVFTPRRKRSMWSQINREHVARLIEDGRMTERGLVEVELAKADGRWDAAYRQSTKDVPDDLRAALDASPAASAFFETLSSQNRFAIVFRVSGVTRPATRAAKIATFVGMLERGETIHPQRAKPA